MNLKNIKLLSLLFVLTLSFSGCAQISDNLNLTTSEAQSANTANDNSNQDNQQANSGKSDSEFDDSDYILVSADSCSLSGGRVANAKVDIGYDSDYANREYWAYTNDYGQLIYVQAAEIILQNDDQEIGGDDRYCSDEAKVPGVEQADLDEGHVIADSLGGESNAYNITPQGSYLNRHGMQAEIEGEIRDAGGATNFTAEIEYPDTSTQIPSTYTLSYEIDGQFQTHTFENEYTPDGEEPQAAPESSSNSTTNTDSNQDVSYENCTAVREAGAAPITKGDPGYSPKLDRDGDGVGCE